jgi:hypothetical protein
LNLVLPDNDSIQQGRGIVLKSILLILLVNSYGIAFADVGGSQYFVSTSAFMLANLNESEQEPPHFYQLNFGYQLTKKDVLSIEFITWRYHAPIGIPGLGSNPIAERFPGYVTVAGAALAYQRFIWKEMYLALHSAWFDQKFYNSEGVKLGSGNQLFLTFRLGYHFSFFSKNVFLEPSIAATHWPVNKGLPAEFQEKENKWPNYEYEPGLHVGYIF